MSEPPFDVKAVFKAARSLAAARRDDEAETLLLQILKIESGGLDALLEYGHVLRRRNDPRTEAVFNKAWTLHPRSAKAGLWLSKLLQARGAAEEATGVLHAQLSFFPDQADLLLELGGLQRKSGDLVGAEGTFRRLWTAHPTEIRGGTWLARVLTSAKRTTEAIEVYRQVLAIDPQHQDSLQRLGGLLTEATLDDEALAVFEAAVALDQPSPAAWLGLARAQGRAVSIQIATGTLREACGRYPADPTIRRALAAQLLRAGLDDEAYDIASEGERLFAAEGWFSSFLVNLDILGGRFQAAQARLAAMPNETPDQRLAILRQRSVLERNRWRIDDSIAIGDEIVAMENAAPHDFSGSALARVVALDVAGARGRLRQASKMRIDKGRGRQKNISQGLLGEVLNDIWTDAAAMDAGRQARADASTAAWLGTVREFPHHTGCAMAFLVHLRQSGRLDTRPAPRAGGSIPRHLHQFWDSETPPSDVSALIDTWISKNPGWSHTLHSQASVTAYLKEHFDEDVLRAFRRSRTVAGKADIFRLALLHREGGVYSDADDRCVQPMEPFLAGRELMLRQEWFGSIGNNFIAAAPGHPVIGVALEQAVEAVLRGDRDSVWLMSGPGLLTRVLVGYLASDEDRLEKLGRAILVADMHETRTFCVSGCEATYKTSAKSWKKVEFGGGRGARPGHAFLPLIATPGSHPDPAQPDLNRSGRIAQLFGAPPQTEEDAG